MHLFNLLSPSNQNPTQKAGFFLSTLFALIFIFLHYPFGGYTYHQNENLCTRESFTLEELHKATAEDLTKHSDDYQKCVNEAVNNTLPFSEWHSNEPIVFWFGSVFQVVLILLLNFILCVSWLWIFQSKKSQ